jgi:outer membrane protein OmpA-like peptidoglycan-associated protein
VLLADDIIAMLSREIAPLIEIPDRDPRAPGHRIRISPTASAGGLHRVGEPAVLPELQSPAADGRQAAVLPVCDRGDDVWVTVESASHFYTLVELKLTAPDFESINDAASMAEAIDKYGRVPLYGIHFLSGRADIAPESVIALRELAIMLDDNPDWNIRVEGHTDNLGAKDANMTLSMRRATAVVAYLIGRGVKRTRLEPGGMADSRPIAANDTEAGRAKNRRIEIVKLPAQ